MDTYEMIYEEYKRYRAIIDGKSLGFTTEALQLQAEFNAFRRGSGFTSKNDRASLLSSFHLFNDRNE